MKPSDRDDLLIRLDERTRNIWRVTESQEKHLEKLNGNLAENIKSTAINASSIKRVWWFIGGMLIVVGGVITTILKIFGVY